MHKIQRKKISEEIVNAIIMMIKGGEYKSGDRLPTVQQFSEMFQVGQSAVREALSALRAMELIDIRHGEGTFVRHFDSHMLINAVHQAALLSSEDMKNLMELRHILEVGTANIAAEHRTDEDIAVMENTLLEMKKNIHNEKIAVQEDMKFHMTIAKATHNQMLIDLMENVSQIFYAGIKEARQIIISQNERYFLDVFAEHQRIFEAIRDGLGNQAGEQMKNHLLHTEEELKKHMKDRLSVIQSSDDMII